MRKARIGICCLSRKTFDWETAYKLYLERVDKLMKDDSVEWFNFDKQVIELDEAEAASTYFRQNEVDGVILVSATFHLGHLALIINKRVNKPIYLWGFNELPYNGGKIRLNAVCGVNLNASNLYKAGVNNYCVHVGDELNMDWVKAMKIKVALESVKIGMVGGHAQGFFNVDVYEPDIYKEYGALVEQYNLSDIFDQEVSDEELNTSIKNVKGIFDTSKLTDYMLSQVARLTVSAEKFLRKNKLDVVTVRCWPEFARDYGVSPCAMMSILQSKGFLLACEGDVEAALSMVAVKAAGEATPFMADLSQVNFEDDYALLWHDGVAPCNLWDGKCNRSLETYFAGGKGVTADFVLKSGKMSILRIDTARGKTRLFYEEGEAVPMDKLLSGTYAKCIFSRPIKDIIDTVVYSGVAHHCIMGYIQYRGALNCLARINGWEVIDENYKG